MIITGNKYFNYHVKLLILSGIQLNPRNEKSHDN
jgi:hypothetical protein